MDEKLKERFAFPQSRGCSAMPIFLMLLFWVVFTASNGSAAGREKNGEAEAEEISVGSLVAMDVRHTVFEIIEGEGKGRKVSMTLKPAADKDAWILSFEGMYRFFLHRSPDGPVEIHKMELLEEKKRIAFSPPFTLIPVVQERDHLPQTGRVDIYDIENGKKAHQGEYTETFKDLRRADFTTPDGAKPGYLQENEFFIDLVFANIEIDLEIGWSDDRKLVYWRPTKTIEKIGLFTESSFRELAVSESP